MVLDQQVAAQGAAPEHYASRVADDQYLAIELALLRAADDTNAALRVVGGAAADILGHCIRVPTSRDRDMALLRSIKAIEGVAERSDQRGDEIQSSWCALLHHALMGGERPTV